MIKQTEQLLRLIGYIYSISDSTTRDIIKLEVKRIFKEYNTSKVFDFEQDK